MVEYALIIGGISLLLVVAFTITPIGEVLAQQPSAVVAALPGDEPPPTPTAPAPSVPASSDDCKNGGWQAYAFKNQGACVSWINANS